jgi:hypothetical protein
MPADCSDGIASGGGASIQSTCPERSAHEAHALAALVGLAGGQRDVRRRHGDAQRPLRLGAACDENSGKQAANCAFHGQDSRR